MPYLSRSLVVMICLFLSVSSFARVPARTISSLMESAPSALPKNITKFRTETLSSAYFSTLEELRHALRQNPDWVLSEDFKNIDQELKDWGLSLPTHPEKNASLDEKRYYMEEMNRLLQQNSEFLGAALNRKTMPAFSTKQALASSTKLQFPSEVILEQMVMKRSPSFSLGIPNINEVKVHPIRSFQNPSHPLYIQPEMMADFALSNRSTYELYDFILSRESLSSQQKQTLILAIEEAVLVMGDHATRFYMGLFYSIPSFSYPTANVPYKQHALETYATAVQTKLIKKLKMQKSWDNKDFELFNEVSVFLAPQRASAVLQAITYLEPDAALWLLTQPLKDGISQQIIAKAQAVHKLQHDIWPNGLLSPKISTNHSFKQLQAERLAALNSYAKVLDDQIMSLSKLFPQLENSSRVFPFPELQISNKIYNAARTARLKKMIENLSLRQREVKNEAKNLAAAMKDHSL